MALLTLSNAGVPTHFFLPYGGTHNEAPKCKNIALSLLWGITSFSLKQSSKLSLSFVKNKQSHLICSLTSLDTELYFCVKTHKE